MVKCPEAFKIQLNMSPAGRAKAALVTSTFIREKSTVNQWVVLSYRTVGQRPIGRVKPQHLLRLWDVAYLLS